MNYDEYYSSVLVRHLFQRTSRRSISCIRWNRSHWGVAWRLDAESSVVSMMDVGFFAWSRKCFFRIISNKFPLTYYIYTHVYIYIICFKKVCIYIYVSFALKGCIYKYIYICLMVLCCFARLPWGSARCCVRGSHHEGPAESPSSRSLAR